MSRVSVVVPCFNAARWIDECVESCVEQGPEQLKEVVIVDDGSTDGSWEKLRALERRFPGIVKIRRNEGKGQNAARNHGFSFATGDFIQWLDADDRLLPGKFAAQLAAFDANPDADVVYSDWRSDWYENGELAKSETHETESHDDYLLVLLVNIWLPLHAYLHRREIAALAVAARGWNPRTRSATDREYITVSALLGAEFERTPGEFAVYRRWSGGNSASLSLRAVVAESFKQETRYLDMIAASDILTPEHKDFYRRVLNGSYLEELYHWPLAPCYRLVGPRDWDGNFAHDRVRLFLPLVLVFSWVKYFVLRPLDRRRPAG